MADLCDVSNMLVAQAAQALYPNGTGQPSTAGVPIRIYAGWPIPASLDADMAAGTCHLTVFPEPHVTRDTTRFFSTWQATSVAAPTLTVTVSGVTLTVGGTVTTPQYVGLVINGLTYAYALQSNDTLISIATALATLISANMPATSSGAVVTIPAARAISGRIGATATMAKEVRRQSHRYCVTAWAPTPALRSAIAGVVDAYLTDPPFRALPDASAAWLNYASTADIDTGERENVYRRDLRWFVEYPTLLSDTTWQVTLPVTTVGPHLADGVTPITSVVVNS